MNVSLLKISDYGGVLRDLLAQSAPEEVPDWFEKVLPAKIEPPAFYADDEYKDHPHKSKMREWHNGHMHRHHIYVRHAIYPDVKQYMDQWEYYWEQEYKSQSKAKEQTYFKWRYFYADKMMEERDKKHD